MGDIAIWRADDMMIRLYREDAIIHAALCAAALLEQGDTEGFFVWKRVAKAVDDLGCKANPGEPMN